MATRVQDEPIEPGELHRTIGPGDEAGSMSPARPKAWPPAKRAIFRFCFVYFILFSLSNQIFSGLFLIPNVEVPDFGTLWPMRQLTFWTAKHLFRVTHDLVYTGSGSGDKTFDWVQAFCMLVIALVAVAVWSLLDRRRENYAALYKWFRLFVRFALASEMFLYGFDKLIPLQMPFPFLTKLLEPYGNFSPMASLWYSIGASPSYEIFAGSAEVLGGLLLLLPRTTTFGALVCLADMTQVFMLNMTYDVPVKLFSLHLILLSMFLLAPDLRRLTDFFFANRATAPSAGWPLFRSSRANRIALAAQAIFGAYLVGANIYQSIHAWHEYGGGRQKPVLYGIWNVDQMTIDGTVHAPAVDDKERWRRVVFDALQRTSFQKMDDTFTGYASSIDEKKRTLTLTKTDDQKWKASLAYERPAPDHLVLDGSMDGHKIHAKMTLFDRKQFTLVNRGFHWISEYPFQR